VDYIENQNNKPFAANLFSNNPVMREVHDLIRSMAGHVR